MSDNYIVSARKYRPQTFDTVVGQEHITTTLKNAIKHQHLAHAYLFCGPRGVGKTTCARILAKTINCESPTEDMEACGVCPICSSFKNNTSFNVFELDAASNNSVDDIRELTNQVRFAPQQGKYKVYIIDEVHMLSASAFNAFLKTLEEPPPYAIFILATTEKHKILPTILSRCQIFDFKRITTLDIVHHLQSIAGKESMIAQEAALHIIAQKSEGCMRDALSMLDRIASFTNGMLTYSNTMEHLNMLDADFYFRLTDGLLSQDVAGTLLALDQAIERGFEGDVIINGLAEHFRNLLLCKDPRMAKLLDVPTEHKPMYNEKANQTPPSFVLSGLNVITECELEYKNATNKRLHVEMCLIRLCFLLQVVSGTQLNTNSLQQNSAGVPNIPADLKKNSDPVANSAVAAPQSAPKLTADSSSNNVGYQQVEEKVSVVREALAVPAQQPIVTPPQQPAPVASIPPVSVGDTRTEEPVKRPNVGGKARVSMDMLDIDVAKAASQVQEKKPLTPEIALEVFDKYKRKLQAEGKNIIYAQFSLLQVNVLPPDEVQLVSPSGLTDTYAREQKNQLIDFYRNETKMIVRITTKIEENEEVVADQTNTVLSKSEMFDVMAANNPNLLKLRDGLGLQIEY
jgi:DNA polymerase-3 subunit gamma/tau